MKSLFLFCCLFWSISHSPFAQEPDWKEQSPLPTGNQLNDVHFVDAQTGWAVGNAGTIVKTSNGGQSWLLQSSGTQKKLNGVHFQNTLVGWVVGNNGTIIKTINGGITWSLLASGTSSNLNDLHFFGELIGWAIGSNGTILKTSNGGSSWIPMTGGTSNELKSISFSDNQNGLAVGQTNTNSGCILKTSNGGSTWSLQANPNYSMEGVHFIDNQTGWAVGLGGIVLKTTNGGITWSYQINIANRQHKSVYFKDSQNGCVVGLNGSIITTSDGGNTWTSQNSEKTNWLYSVHLSDTQTGWAVGQGGIVLKTTNGGSSWTIQQNGTSVKLNWIYFVDNLLGWAVGINRTILKTSNGGKNWTQQMSGGTGWFNSVNFINKLTGWAVGSVGIFKTTNGGTTWVPQISPPSFQLRSVKFIDIQTGWVVGDNGTILKTTDGGNTWTSQASGTTNALTNVTFINSQKGFAVGTVGTILITNNGGTVWTAYNSGIFSPLYGVYFSDPLSGWVVGHPSIILKTTNGGNTWSSQYSGTSAALNTVCSIDSQNCWIGGENGTILKTTNGGATWSPQNSGTTNQIQGIHINDPIHGWAVGNFGTIITTITNNPIDPETPTTVIKGNLFEKANANCTVSNRPVAGKLVKAQPGPYYGFSQIDGRFSLRIPLSDFPVTYTLQPVTSQTLPFQENTVCPPSGQIAFEVGTTQDTLSGNNFGFEITPCHHLDVQISSNRRRRCFLNTTSVSYVNQGSLVAPNAFVIVEFPHWVRPLSASRPHVTVNDSVWRFNLGDVAPGSGGSFTIQDSVRCGNVSILGLSQCTKATIYPAPDCPSPSAWSGAEVSVSGRCENGLVKLGIYNRTTVNMPDSVDYWVYMDSVQVKVGKVKLLAGDSLKIQVVPNGMGVYLSVNQVANHPGQWFVSTAVEGCGFFPLSGFSGGVSTHLPIAQQPNSKIQCLPIIGAYDPNDKQAFPIGFTNQNIIRPNTRLEYLLRFQNTGNDTAFTVYVIDTLDKNLNVESFEMGAASHPYQLTMQTVKSGKTFLRWQFNNINLPDSATNEPASNGFIQFRISPKPGLALGSKVRNHGEIYFDFNPPIYTNQTLTTFDNLVFTNPLLNDNVQIITSAASQWSRSETIQVFPNPFSHSISLRSETAETISISFCDLMGRELFSKSFSGSTELNLSHLPAGVYLLKFPGQNRVIKVVKE